MAQPEQFFAQLEKDRYFSTFDATKGYWQGPMKADDKAFTAFVVHRRLHQFKVMPSGLVNAPAIFNRLMRKLLFRRNSHYVHDVLAQTPTWENHLQTTRDTLSGFLNAHLSLQPSKYNAGSSTMPYLGHRAGNSKLKPKLEMVNKILQTPRPLGKKQWYHFGDYLDTTTTKSSSRILLFW